MEKLSFKVLDYDAPLDLILTLIARHRLDILNIDISSLLEQYMAAIRQWQEQDMEIASEFLEMASRLVYMKTVSLLPRREEESEKLREELTGQLVEYGVCRLVAARLGERNRYGYVFSRAPAPQEIDETYTLTHDAQVLLSALMDAQGKGERRLPPPKAAFDPIVAGPMISVSSRIFSVLRRLRRAGAAQLLDFFDPALGRSGMVATFLALLELMKAGKVAFSADNSSLTLTVQEPNT